MEKNFVMDDSFHYFLYPPRVIVVIELREI